LAGKSKLTRNWGSIIVTRETPFFAAAAAAGLTLLIGSGFGLSGTLAAQGAGSSSEDDARLSKLRAKRAIQDANVEQREPPSAATLDAAGVGFFLEELVGFLACVDDPAGADCEAFDFNGDGSFDLLDFSEFQANFLGKDCNGNGIPDADELAQGTARDLNENGQLDECDSRAALAAQRPDGNDANVPSNIDWSDDTPNVVLADDFSLPVEQAITTVRWWGRQLEPPPPPPPAPAPASADSGTGAIQVASTRPALSAIDVRAVRSGMRAAQIAGDPIAGSASAAAPLVGGDTCDTATVISTLPFSDTGNTCTFTDDYDEICDPQVDFPGSPDVVYSFTPATNLNVDISLCGNSAYDTKLYVYEGACPGTMQSGTEIACNEDFCLTPSIEFVLVSSLSQVAMVAGTTYYIVVDGTNDQVAFPGLECGAYTIDIEEAPEVCGPGNGDCFVANGTPGCEDVECCEIVCTNDPFCCGAPDTGGNPGFWDELCAEDAAFLCGEPPPPPECPAEDTLLGQTPTLPVNAWVAGASDAGWFEGPLKRFESFQGLTDPICDIHWWGLNAFNDGSGFSMCEKAPDTYEITFYRDFFGEPDLEDVVCSYTLAPTKVDTGLTYSGFSLYEYGIDLGACCDLESGWVSIQASDTLDNCQFLWMSQGDEGAGFHVLEDIDGSLVSEAYDLSLCLTGEPDVSGWFISFHEALTDGSPEAEALGVYFCDTRLVEHAAVTDQQSCDAPSFTRYTVELADCCLVHAVEAGPARPDFFVAARDIAYDLDIQAVTGVRFIEEPDTGVCIEQATTSTADGDFWAWHTTDNVLRARAPLSSSLSMGLGGEWLYGPWGAATPPACGGPNMAFELLTLVPKVVP
jgi:hypothetical protein